MGPNVTLFGMNDIDGEVARDDWTGMGGSRFGETGLGGFRYLTAGPLIKAGDA